MISKKGMRTQKTKKPVQSEVISIVAHQLKDPLSVIKGYLEMLLSEDFGRINLKQREYLQDALETVKKLTETAENLLDVSRIEEAKLKVELFPIALEEITRNIVSEFDIWARASNCQIIFKSPKRLPKVLADPVRVRQAIENLIANALTYKSPGRGRVEISLIKKGREILFACQDNGIGIPKKDFKKVFTKFYRSEKAVEMDPSGSGLGLYVSKAIVELSGGKIWFEKNKEAGITFYFTLPIAAKARAK